VESIDIDSIKIEWWMDEHTIIWRLYAEEMRQFLLRLGGTDIAEDEDFLKRVTDTCRKSMREFQEGLAQQIAQRNAEEVQQ
jgi:hypothetical protein